MNIKEEKTENLYREWALIKIELPKLKENVASLQEKVDKQVNTQSIELSAETVDKILLLSKDLEQRKINLEELRSTFEEVENELIERIKVTNAKSIIIPSNQFFVKDHEIFLNKEEKLEYRKRL